MRISDWSSDVCSSDLHCVAQVELGDEVAQCGRVRGGGIAADEVQLRIRVVDGAVPGEREHDVVLRLVDRKSVVSGKSVSVSVDLGGRRIIKKKKRNDEEIR